jgi:hypothetical protein
MPRYQQFIKTLNNIPKVCILLNMVMGGLPRSWAGEAWAAGGVVRSLGSVTAGWPEATKILHRSMLRSSVPAGFPT